MKNKITSLVLAFVAMLFVACATDEKDLFSQSASERIETSVVANKALLQVEIILKAVTPFLLSLRMVKPQLHQILYLQILPQHLSMR